METARQDSVRAATTTEQIHMHEHLHIMKPNILITGASGFIGSFLCEEALRHGFNTYAALRSGSSRRWLQQHDLRFITLDFTDLTTMTRQFREAGVQFDVVIHAGGATKCLNRDEFMQHNYQSTVNLVEALVAAGNKPSTFVYLSSLSAIYGSAYGESKLKTEDWLKTHPLFTAEGHEPASRLFIFRPTGVYGPREKDYYMMAQSIGRHIDFSVGFEPQQLTFVYVLDLVRAIFAAIEGTSGGGTFNVSDGCVYSSSHFSRLIQQEMGVRHVLHITAPLWFLYVISVVAEVWGKMVHRPSTLNRDKYRIMAQRDWTCDITPLIQTIGYTPQWQLEQGVKETIQWYKDNNWL